MTDAQFTQLWLGNKRCYLVASQAGAMRLKDLIGAEQFETVMESGGKVLLTNFSMHQKGSLLGLSMRYAQPLKLESAW